MKKYNKKTISIIKGIQKISYKSTSHKQKIAMLKFLLIEGGYRIDLELLNIIYGKSFMHYDYHTFVNQEEYKQEHTKHYSKNEIENQEVYYISNITELKKMK